jgi:hypothetical protein
MTPEEEKIYLEQKIEQVKLDIEGFKQGGNADSKLEHMMSYQEYLQDELKILQKKLNGVING